MPQSNNPYLGLGGTTSANRMGLQLEKMNWEFAGRLDEGATTVYAGLAGKFTCFDDGTWDFQFRDGRTQYGEGYNNFVKFYNAEVYPVVKQLADQEDEIEKQCKAKGINVHPNDLDEIVIFLNSAKPSKLSEEAQEIVQQLGLTKQASDYTIDDYRKEFGKCPYCGKEYDKKGGSDLCPSCGGNIKYDKQAKVAAGLTPDQEHEIDVYLAELQESNQINDTTHENVIKKMVRQRFPKMNGHLLNGYVDMYLETDGEPEAFEKAKNKQKADDMMYDFRSSAVQKAPTRDHRPALWGGMLGTWYAMSPTGETRYFDYDAAGALTFLGWPNVEDIRFAKMDHWARMRYRIPNAGTNDSRWNEDGPSIGRGCFFVKDKGQQTWQEERKQRRLKEKEEEKARKQLVETRGDISIQNGSIKLKGREIGRVDQKLKFGYHPAIHLKINNNSEWFEMDTPNLMEAIWAKIFEWVPTAKTSAKYHDETTFMEKHDENGNLTDRIPIQRYYADIVKVLQQITRASAGAGIVYRVQDGETYISFTQHRDMMYHVLSPSTFEKLKEYGLIVKTNEFDNKYGIQHQEEYKISPAGKVVARKGVFTEPPANARVSALDPKVLKQLQQKYPKTWAIVKAKGQHDYGNLEDLSKTNKPVLMLEKNVVYYTLARFGPDVAIELIGRSLPKIRRACKGDILAVFEQGKLYDVLDSLGFFGKNSDKLRYDADRYYASKEAAPKQVWYCPNCKSESRIGGDREGNCLMCGGAKLVQQDPQPAADPTPLLPLLEKFLATFSAKNQQQVVLNKMFRSGTHVDYWNGLPDVLNMNEAQDVAYDELAEAATDAGIGPKTLAKAKRSSAKEAAVQGYKWEWSGNDVILISPGKTVKHLVGDQARQFDSEMDALENNTNDDAALANQVDLLIAKYFVNTESENVKTGASGEFYYPLEVGLAVKDYLDEMGPGEAEDEDYEDDDDETDAWDDASVDNVAAEEQAKSEVAAWVTPEELQQLRFENAEFEEFDSGNISHAVAYWTIDVIGPEAIIKKIGEADEDPGSVAPYEAPAPDKGFTGDFLPGMKASVTNVQFLCEEGGPYGQSEWMEKAKQAISASPATNFLVTGTVSGDGQDEDSVTVMTVADPSEILGAEVCNALQSSKRVSSDPQQVRSMEGEGWFSLYTKDELLADINPDTLFENSGGPVEFVWDGNDDDPAWKEWSPNDDEGSDDADECPYKSQHNTDDECDYCGVILEEDEDGHTASVKKATSDNDAVPQVVKDKYVTKVEFGRNGISGRCVLHPAELEALQELEPGQSDTFTDEQRVQWQVTRNQDGTTHFKSLGLEGLEGAVRDTDLFGNPGHTASQKTAGASNFREVGKGKDAKDAFNKLVDQARHEHGYGGYSGSIAEKGSDGFVMLTPPPGVKPESYMQWVMHGSESKAVELKTGKRCPRCKKGKLTVGMVAKEFNGHKWEQMEVQCSNGCRDIWSSAKGSGPNQKFYTYKNVEIPPQYQAQVARDHQRVDDKYGPCGCIQLKKNEFLFFGWAAS